MVQYAERLPIGTEKVIRTVTHETVKQFYHKWYNLSNMAVFAVGDFPDTQVCFFLSLSTLLGSSFIHIFTVLLCVILDLLQAVVELIKEHFDHKAPAPCPPPVIPEFPVPSHSEPRFSCFVESEAAGVSTVILIYLASKCECF